MPSNLNDPYNLERFVAAQNEVYDTVCAELRAGEKRSHWMWFIFPQLKGLGSSSMAARYAISGLPEAEAYLQHEILGARLGECSELVLQVEGRTIEQIFGYPDYLKFRSSMTLFARAATDNRVFNHCLEKYFAGEPDSATLRLL